MKRHFLSTTSVVAIGVVVCTAGMASAGDLEGGPSWELYLGVHGGIDWLDGNVDTNFTSASADRTGGVFGGLAGINYRHGYWLFGLEGDFGISTNSRLKGGFSCDSAFGLKCDANANYHVRGRIGRMITPNVDVFAAAGLALLDFEFDEFGTKHDKTLSGVSVGGGADISFRLGDSGLKPVLRVEALYDHYCNERLSSDYVAKNFHDFTLRGAAIFRF